jgi:hypothetical protein
MTITGTGSLLQAHLQAAQSPQLSLPLRPVQRQCRFPLPLRVNHHQASRRPSPLPLRQEDSVVVLKLELELVLPWA